MLCATEEAGSMERIKRVSGGRAVSDPSRAQALRAESGSPPSELGRRALGEIVKTARCPGFIEALPQAPPG